MLVDFGTLLTIKFGLNFKRLSHGKTLYLGSNFAGLFVCQFVAST